MDPRREAARLLLLLGPVLRRIFAEALRTGAGPQSMLRVGLLRRLGEAPCRVSDLAAAAGVAAPTVSPVVDELVRAGLVERRRDPRDRRAVVLSLTPAGRAELEGALSTLEDALARRLRSLDAAAARGAVRALEDLYGALSRSPREDRRGAAGG